MAQEPGSVLVRNPGARRGPVGLAATREPLGFHRSLPGYARTDLVDAPEIAAALGVGRALVKVESSRFGLPAFKMLGASWATYQVLVGRLGRQPSWTTAPELAEEFASLHPLTLLAATDGNHGRAVAAIARLLGFDARIFVPRDMVAARIAGIESEGAEVEIVDGEYDDAVVRAAAAASDRRLVISDTSWPGYTEPPRRVMEGYSTIFFEIEDALASAGVARPTLVFTPAGVGALAAATVAYARGSALPAAVVSVEPEDAACVMASCVGGAPTPAPGPHRSMMVGLNCANVSPVAWPVLARGLDWCATVSDARTVDALHLLADCGIASGETGAASLAGALAAADHRDRAEVGLDADATVLILCTEGVTDALNYEAVVGCAPEAVGPITARRVIGN
jgi:diaminopropionate ammonia-lyase